MSHPQFLHHADGDEIRWLHHGDGGKTLLFALSEKASICVFFTHLSSGQKGERQRSFIDLPDKYAIPTQV